MRMIICFFEKTNKKINKIVHNKNGMTLVELIVTFALMSLFAVSTTQLLSTAIKTYHQIRGLNEARQVSDTLLEKITGEIEGAKADFEATAGADDTSAVIHIYDNGQIIQLRDRTGSKIAITSSNEAGNVTERQVTSTYGVNQILIYYYLLENDSGGTKYEAVDWTYDSIMNMGYHIKNLTFSQADSGSVEYPKNVIKVDLTVENDKYGSFSATRYVECYNFTTEQDYDRILDEGGTAGGGSGGEGGESGGDTGDGNTGNNQTQGEAVITIPDSQGNQHTLKNSYTWEDIKAKIENGGWNIASGSILTDATGTYLCWNWSNWIRIDDGTDVTLEYLAGKYPNWFRKLDNTSILIAEDRTVLPNGQGTVWDPLPQPGTICYYNGSYYVAPTEINAYTMPPGGWIQIINN